MPKSGSCAAPVVSETRAFVRPEMSEDDRVLAPTILLTPELVRPVAGMEERRLPAARSSAGDDGCTRPLVAGYPAIDQNIDRYS